MVLDKTENGEMLVSHSQMDPKESKVLCLCDSSYLEDLLHLAHLCTRKNKIEHYG